MNPKEKIKISRFAIMVLSSVFALLLIYVASYFLLMRRGKAVFDDHGNLCYASAFIFSGTVRVPGELSIYAHRACFANILYAPMEKYFFKPIVVKKKKKTNSPVDPNEGNKYRPLVEYVYYP